MKTVATFLNPEEAKVARSFLSANGIDAIIGGEESLSVMPHIGMGGKAYQLMVADEDFYRTTNLLAEVEENARDQTERPAGPVWTRRRLFLALAIIGSFFLVFFGRGYAADHEQNKADHGYNKKLTPEHTGFNRIWWAW